MLGLEEKEVSQMKADIQSIRQELDEASKEFIQTQKSALESKEMIVEESF